MTASRSRRARSRSTRRWSRSATKSSTSFRSSSFMLSAIIRRRSEACTLSVVEDDKGSLADEEERLVGDPAGPAPPPVEIAAAAAAAAATAVKGDADDDEDGAPVAACWVQ